MLFLKSLFKSKPTPVGVVTELLENTTRVGGVDLKYKVEQKESQVVVNIHGEDASLLCSKDGKFILALQVYFNKVLQHCFAEKKYFVKIDCKGFFREKEEHLLDLARKLRKKALTTDRPVYFKKALPPFQRRKIHQCLAKEGGVHTSSVGEGFYKNICVSPQKRASAKTY